MKMVRTAKVAGWTPPGVTDVTTSYFPIDLSKTQSLTKDPNWRDRIARGDNATLDYDMMMRFLTPGGVTVTAVPASKGDSVTVTGHIPGMEPYTTYDSVLASRLIGQAGANALSRARSSFSAGTVLGELREALQMVRKPALSLQKLTSDYTRRAQAYRYEYLRKGMSHKVARDAAKALPDLYLEFQFGWKPLASDVESGIDAVSRSTKDPKKIRFNGYAKQQIMLPRVNVTSFNNFPTSAYQLRVDREVVGDYSAKVAGSASLKLGFGMPAFQAGSTIPDLIPTLWNLAPWSFLIDYFSNVGQVLEANATASLLKVNFGYSNARAILTTINTCYYVGGSPVTFGSKCIHFNRRKITANFPIPSFSIDKRPSDGQQINIAALVASRALEISFRKTVPPNTYHD